MPETPASAEQVAAAFSRRIGLIQRQDATATMGRRFPLDNLQHLQLRDGPRVEVDSLLESAREAGSIQGDNPPFLDNHLLDDSSVNERGTADGGVLAFRRAAFNQMLAPFIGQNFCQTVSGRRS